MHDKLWSEMMLAKKIQTILLPLEPAIPGYAICVYSQPADEVGGDYYDIINTNNCDWIIIGDVSGHGVPAGLIMMMAQTSIQLVIEQNKNISPAGVIKAINSTITKNIKRLNETKYMTLSVFSVHHDGRFLFSGLHQNIFI